MLETKCKNVESASATRDDDPEWKKHVEGKTDATREQVERERRRRNGREGLRATRSRGGCVVRPPEGEKARCLATTAPRRDRPRLGVPGAAAQYSREPPARMGQQRNRETYHHEAARAALLRVHRGDGAEGAAARAGRDAPQVGREAT